MNMDPELADEMIRLLGGELKVVKAQLREAQEQLRAQSVVLYLNENDDGRQFAQLKVENEKLRDENGTLRTELGCLLNAGHTQMQGSIKTEDIGFHLKQGGNGIFSDDYRIRELEQLLQEQVALKDKLVQEKNDEVDRLREKLSTTKDKYRTAKETKMSLQKSLNESQAEIATVKTELEKAVEDLAKKQDDTRHRRQGFEASEFLHKIYPAVDTQPPYRYIRPFSDTPHFKLPRRAREICQSSYAPLHLGRQEFLLAEDDSGHVTHGVAFVPLYRYNPKVQEENDSFWEISTHFLNAGESRELFYMSGHKWRYLGTVECITSTSITTNELLRFGPDMVEYAFRRHLLQPQLVPPVISKMIREMFEMDVFKPIACFALRCVGFNASLHEALMEGADALVQNMRSPRKRHSPYDGDQEGTKRVCK